jgi:hypothetical protein
VLGLGLVSLLRILVLPALPMQLWELFEVAKDLHLPVNDPSMLSLSSSAAQAYLARENIDSFGRKKDPDDMQLPGVGGASHARAVCPFAGPSQPTAGAAVAATAAAPSEDEDILDIVMDIDSEEEQDQQGQQQQRHLQPPRSKLKHLTRSDATKRFPSTGCIIEDSSDEEEEIPAPVAQPFTLSPRISKASAAASAAIAAAAAARQSKRPYTAATATTSKTAHVDASPATKRAKKVPSLSTEPAPPATAPTAKGKRQRRKSVRLRDEDRF